MPLNPPKTDEEFFIWLKDKSEKLWKSIKINPVIYGFQIQKGTEWNHGLSDAQVKQFETDLGFNFPEIYKTFLKHMNGTDKPAVNVYGESGELYAYAPEYYTYPRDLKIIQEMIEWICESFKIKVKDIDGHKIPFIIPIVGHRFIIVDQEGENPVLSMYGKDVIPYAPTFRLFLLNDLFRNHLPEVALDDISVNFWLK